jgi:acyl-homoserine lactone acylase PvdQ
MGWGRSVVVGAVVAGMAGATLGPASSQDAPRFPTSEELLAVDDAALHGTITPPGVPLLEKQAELEAYDQLVQGYPTLTEAEITGTYFKDGSFDVPTEVSREYFPRADVRVLRDAEWGVPHVYGVDDGAAAFGAGYVAVEDRLPIIMLLTALGRAEAFELLGDGASWLADAEIARLYGYTEAEYQQMIDRIPAVYGQTGQDLVDLLDELTQGMNAAVIDMRSGVLPVPPSLGDAGLDLPGPFRTTDIVAIVSIVRALFGAGGGNELANANRFLQSVADFGEEGGAEVYEDLRNRFDLDGPVHTAGSFPYLVPQPDAVDPAAHAFGFGPGATGIEGLLEQIEGLFPGGLPQALGQSAALAEASRIRTEHLVLDTPLGSIDLSRPNSMSNYLAVDGTLSSTGHPILLGGPQAAYFDPQILSENEIHGDRLHARGATFPGFGLVIVGRTLQSAWSPTAGGSDMIDLYVEELCEPDGGTPTEQSRHHLFDGECVEMDRRTIRTVTDDAPLDLPGRDLLPDIIVERTVHGPVVARGMVGDTPVAVSRKRSTYLKELDPGVSILKLNRNEVQDPQAFVDAFEESHNLSTNWAWIDDDDIAYVHGGLYPLRPETVHPDFPVWGTGEWEWLTDDGGDEVFLDEHPHAINPPDHLLVSWNNRIAPDWAAADANWGFSGRYRANLLEDPLRQQAPGSVTPVKMVQIMEQAGLSDLRGTNVLPLALRVLDAAEPPTPEAAAARDALAAWMEAGALRRDGDLDGAYDQAAAIGIMDAWWEPMIRAMFDPALGDVGSRSAQGFHNAPSSTGSAFQGGFYGQVWTDLAMVLGDEVRSPTSQVYCGADGVGADGTLEACAERLWASLAAVAGAEPADAQAERILFLPNAALSMHWVNRPTTQHIAMFGRLDEPAAAPSPTTAAPATTAPVPGRSGRLPATGQATPWAVAALLASAAIACWTLRARLDRTARS